MRNSTKAFSLVGGASLGAGLMFFLDTDNRGKRRRALMRDQGVRWSRKRQSHWSPTARTAAALMGSAAVLYGLSQRTMGSTTLAASGLGLLVRSATNQKFTDLIKFKEQCDRPQLQKAA